ncbi:MAG TPA: ribosome biogenesis GTP-binding protein YihA/YsxC [Burkholderiaceae bacterium]|nr:ribosome biogenesis GTP-binding protein YihA/YsxC [Burkholderiaceae bacterium]
MAPPEPHVGVSAKAALAWAHSARFLVTASRVSELPEPGLPEIAFVGRSNAGKSSAINALAQHKRLAFASKTPGRTQHLNLFNVGPPDAPDAIWVDLPGYGFAAVERESKKRWQAVMADYLAQRRSLTGLVLLVDARHGFTELDRQLLGYVWPRLAGGDVKLLVLLTKADKVSRRDGQRALDLAQRLLAEVATEHSDIGVALFSALSGQGLDDVALTLRAWASQHAA